MNKLSKLIAVSVVGLSSSAMIVTFAASTNANNNPIISGVQAESERSVNFATEKITRRVYFVNNEYYGHTWYEGYTMYVYAYSLDETKNNMSAAATTIYGSYYKGLFYADVTFNGVGDSIKVIITTSNTWSGGETASVTLPALSDKTADLVWINNGNPSVGNADVGAAEGKCILDHISTCTKDFASGFNAYPQLHAIFNLDNVSGMDHQTIGDLDKEDQGGYNALQKINKIKALYESEGWIAA